MQIDSHYFDTYHSIEFIHYLPLDQVVYMVLSYLILSN